MMTVCPSCRHTFQPDLQPECSTMSGGEVQLSISTTIRLPTICPSGGVNCTVNFNSNTTASDGVQRGSVVSSALSKEDLIRNTLSGGSVICINDDTTGGYRISSGNFDRLFDDNHQRRNSDKNLLVEQNVALRHQNNDQQLDGDDGDDDKVNNDRRRFSDEKNFNRKTIISSSSDSVTPTSVVSFVIPQSASSSDFAAYSVELDRLLKKTVRNFALSTSEQDLQRLTSSLTYLQLSGWYHRGLSWKDAICLLMSSTVGTFLVRDSSDSQFFYSLSIQTKCGPTSIRIYYHNGEFRLDAEPHVAKFMPRFSCVLKLIQYYVESTKTRPLRCFQNESQTTSVWNNACSVDRSVIFLMFRKEPVERTH